MVTKLVDNEIRIFLDYDESLIKELNKIPDVQYSTRGDFWYAPVTTETYASLKALGFNLPEYRPTDFTPLIGHYTLPLYPYQQEIADFMVKTGSCLNASFVGSGKTLTSLAVCLKQRSERTLIIAPKSVTGQWAHTEITKWLPDADITFITGSQRSRVDQYINYSKGFMVIGYETARNDIAHLETIYFDVIITDEAHKIANPKTKLYKALLKLKAKHRYALTATPVMNKPDDLYGIINWLKPNSLGNYYGFLNRYIVKNDFGGTLYYKNMDELAARCAPYIIKKTLKEVGMELPEYTETDIPVTLSPIERKNYDLMKKELLFDILPMVINKIDNPAMLNMSVVKLGKLFELCDSMELIGEHTDSSKLEVLKEHLESTLQNGQKAIIITKFSRMVDILAKALHQYRPEVITGSTNNRQDVLTRFAENEDDKSPRILIGTEAIGQGLNLQVANVLYNYDSAWNPARMEQRAGRIYRNGQDKPVFIYNLICEKTVETWLQKKLIGKSELSASLLPKSFEAIKEMLE